MDYLHKTVGTHPVATAGFIAVLIVLVVILTFVMLHYKGKVDGDKSGFAAGAMVSPFPAVGPVQACGRGWDPAASAEAQALATTGSLLHDSYGEGKLQGAVDGAFDTSASLNDEQLSALMREGSAP